MNPFEVELAHRLATVQEQGLYRQLRRVDAVRGVRLRMGGGTVINFSGNDYLGLTQHPRLRQAAQQAVARYGAGAGAARLLSGSLRAHHDLESALAAFLGTESALAFSSGYATALGTLSALVQRDDVVVLDKRIHACWVDAARLCGARLRVFRHNDLNDLERILKWARAQSQAGVLIVTESVFSMDGDSAPLRHMVALKEQYGAWLLVDEAHALGAFGPQGRGLAAALGVGDRIEIRMGTLGKALGAAGGFIAGSRTLIELLIQRARSFLFSTAPVPAAAAAALEGVRLVQSAEGEGRRHLLQARARQCLRAGLPVPAILSTDAAADSAEAWGAIIPLVLGQEDRALAAAATLHRRGLFLPAIRYPTVGRGAARLRISLSAAHSAEDVEKLVDALASVWPTAAAAVRVS